MAKVNLEVGKTINITFDIKAVVLKNVFELRQTCSKADRCVCQKCVLFNLVPHENDLLGVSPVYYDGELSN